MKPLTLEETALKEEMKERCLAKGQYIDEKAKDKFKMLCHLEDFEVQYWELQQENKQLREKVNKFNNDKINNENKYLKGSGKILGEKKNNQRKELQRLNNKIEKLKVINEEHKKLNAELREENQKYKEAIDRAIEYLEAKRIREKAIVDIDVLEGILKEVE